MATVDGYDPQELEQQASLLEEAIAAALILVTAQAAAELGTPGIPVVSIDALSIISTLWGERTDDELIPVVDGVLRRSAELIVKGVADAAPDMPKITPIADVTAADLLAQARNRLVGIGDDLWQNARAALIEGLNEGESIPELAARVRDAAGVTEPRARTIARTECLPGDTVVDSARMTALFRRWYDGPMIEIVTRSGRKFSGTPNHPVFTRCGWVSLGELTEGDQLICDQIDLKYSRSSSNQDVNGPPASIGEIFDAVAAICVPVRERTGQPDFHGDGIADGYVDILRPDRVLLNGVFTELNQSRLESIFSPSEAAEVALSASSCDACRDIPIDGTACRFDVADWDSGIFQPSPDPSIAASVAFGEDVDRCTEPVFIDDLLGWQIRSQAISESGGMEELASVRTTATDTRSLDDSSHGTSVETSERRYLERALSSPVEFDYVDYIGVAQWSGHVFNLSTIDGYFVSNGIYTSNTISVSNAASIAQARSAGIDMIKVWNSTEDMRTRLYHQDADRQQVPLNEPFEVGGEQLDFPGDPRGRADNIINCRCSIFYLLDSSEVTTAATRQYVRDEEGQFAETPAGEVAADKLKIGGRLPSGDEVVSSAKAKVSPDSEFQFLGAAVDTPGGAQIRLGVAGEPKTWAAHNDPELQERIDELKLRQRQMEELPEQEFDEDVHEALSAEINELGESQTDLTASLTPEGVAQLQYDTFEASASAAEWSEIFQSFYDDPQVATLDKEINRLNRSRPLTPETQQRIGAISEQIDRLASERGVDLDTEREFGTGIIEGLDGYDLGWLVAGTDDGEGGWELSIAVRPPDAGNAWYPGGDQVGTKAVFGEDEVEKLDDFLFSLRQTAEGDVTTIASLVTHLPGKHDQSSHGRKESGAKARTPSPKRAERPVQIGGFSRLTPGQAVQMQKEMEADAPMTTREIGSLRNYTGSGYRPINKALRGITAPQDVTDDVTDDIQGTAAALRPLPQNVRVTRSVSEDAFGVDLNDVISGEKLLEILSRRRGSLVQERGFTSTSLNRVQTYGRIHMDIDVPSGVRATYVTDNTRNPGISEERELILEPGLKMRIISVKAPRPGAKPPQVRMRLRVER